MAESESMDATYVTMASWIREAGRPDLIDDVADQFERPAAPGAQAFWSPGTKQHWPRTPRGWRSRQLMPHRSADQRVNR